MNNIYFGKNWTEQMLSSYWFSPTAARNKNNTWSASEMIDFRLHFNSQWNAFIRLSVHHINIQSILSKKRREQLTILFLNILKLVSSLSDNAFYLKKNRHFFNQYWPFGTQFLIPKIYWDSERHTKFYLRIAFAYHLNVEGVQEIALSNIK